VVLVVNVWGTMGIGGKRYGNSKMHKILRNFEELRNKNVQELTIVQKY
jgi:hypothetical protein